ncbi:uncharacterized protein LOC124646738 [Lolium rigidum]|uniref:uncharacterized protein LOC124646738 n=1 Tax=Lolium rigidum TaxID=89674 RepID=UPI001F5C89CE|nr:uncharacterized protein LOC124646738 [Lolium rigidum]
METEWQRDLAGLGLAGICRETSRVVRVILPNFANVGPALLSALLLAGAAFLCSIFSRVASYLDDGTSLPRLVADSAAIGLLISAILGLFLLCTAAYALAVASLYRTGGDLLAADRILKEDLPVGPLVRLLSTFLLVAAPYLPVSTALSVAALLVLQDDITLPLRLLGWATAAYVATVYQLACVASVLEDTELFGAVRRSRDLLTGKFWAAASVLVTLNGCIIAVLEVFKALVLDDALDLGLAFQVTAAAAVFVALCEVLIVTLVAQPVIYMVCMSHHLEVVHKAHHD